MASDAEMLCADKLRRALQHVHGVRTADFPFLPLSQSHLSRSQSSPPSLSRRRLSPHRRNPRLVLPVNDSFLYRLPMLAAPAIDLSFDDADWIPPKSRLYRTASVGNSWGVTSIGGGYKWSAKRKDAAESEVRNVDEEAVSFGSFIESEPFSTARPAAPAIAPAATVAARNVNGASNSNNSFLYTSPLQDEPRHAGAFTTEPVLSDSPLSRSPFSSSAVSLTSMSTTPETSSEVGTSSRPSLSRQSSVPRPRRRSSQQRVSVIAGRLSMAQLEPPSEPALSSPRLLRYGSQSSFLSATSAAPPSPSAEKESFLGGRSISEFVIEGDLGRGAYGVVKRAREMKDNGEMGDQVIIKQIVKSRILADCWKKHPKYGTIPIEIYVMSAISSTSYNLPPKRPWDPSRMYKSPEDDPDPWIEGKAVNGHPSICTLLDFFEDNHYYYLVMPSTIQPRANNAPAPPSDLFDLVENYPQGLPPDLVRSYLGQIADALAFLHSRGIVHRDIKDENVILGKKPGSCILIDFGSSGIVKKNGWDTFSGTLDYAGPEILRGERYHGKEQDVWAFGVVAFVLLVGECPFNTAAEAQDGLESPFANASIALDERCGDGKEREGEEADGGGALGDAAALVRACLNVDLKARPTFEKILECKFLSGGNGWGMDVP